MVPRRCEACALIGVRLTRKLWTGIAMRDTEANGWMVQNSSETTRRALRLAMVALGVGLVMTAGAARAQDDDEDDKTFEEKIIENNITGIGGPNMDHNRHDYRQPAP